MARLRTACALIAALVLGGGVLAGCGDDNPLDLPAYDAGGDATSTIASNSTPSGEPTPTARPSVSRAATPPPQVHYTPADRLGLGAWVERGRVRVASPQQRAVVDAVAGYLTVRVQLSNTWAVDETALAEVASGQAVSSARERAAAQREAGLRSVGRFVLNVSSVKVAGDRATVIGCDFDSTTEVDDETGATEVPPPGGVRIAMRLVRTASTWRVIDWPTKPVPYCDDWRHR